MILGEKLINLKKYSKKTRLKLLVICQESIVELSKEYMKNIGSSEDQIKVLHIGMLMQWASIILNDFKSRTHREEEKYFIEKKFEFLKNIEDAILVELNG